jgi:auxin efflux carrier family protein
MSPFSVSCLKHVLLWLTLTRLLVWALTYNLLSIAVGWTLTRFFDLPKWFTPAMTFNNTTSFPLLLIQSLGSAGVLTALAKSDDDEDSEIISRAKSYFLVASVISNMLTFGLGGSLLGANDEHAEDEFDRNLREQAGEEQPTTSNDGGEDGENESNERTSLLPGRLPRYADRAARKTAKAQIAVWDRLHPSVQRGLARISRFMSPPAIGALIGVFLGLIPPLKQAFFSSSDEGGIFNAWVTVSLKNIGELFVTLQVIIVGIKLAHSLRKMRRGDDAGSISWTLLGVVIVIRFIIWPM